LLKVLCCKLKEVKNMGAILPYDITRAIEKIIPDPEIARKVIETIEEGITAIEEKAKDQKIIIKSEVKDELTKELVTKEELKATEERLRGEIKATEERLRTEIHKWRADTIKWMFIFWMGQIAALVGVLKIMLK
jgi:hypothetical protein